MVALPIDHLIKGIFVFAIISILYISLLLKDNHDFLINLMIFLVELFYLSLVFLALKENVSELVMSTLVIFDEDNVAIDWLLIEVRIFFNGLAAVLFKTR